MLPLPKRIIDLLGWVLLLLALAAATHAGLKGLDFGQHWDEGRLIGSVEQSVETGLLLPRWYNYPSVSFDVALLPAVPEALRELRRDRDPRTAMLRAAADVTTHAFLLRERTVFFLLSSATAVWVFLLVLAWRRNAIEAGLAAALLLGSWEVNYHARWIAPDAVLMQFAALATLLMFFAQRDLTYSKRWLVLAAAAVGVAIGTKYPGGILVAALAWTAFRCALQQTAKPVPAAAMACGLAILVFVMTTPGLIAEPAAFVSNVVQEVRHYATAHAGYTVPSPLVHAGRMAEYLGTVAFSPYLWIACVITLLAAVGAGDLIARERKLAIWFLLVPVVYAFYLSLQKVMIVRNLLIVLPYLAVLGARGASVLVSRIPSVAARAVAFAAILAMVGVNYVWLDSAADSIVERQSMDREALFRQFVAAHPATRFFLTRGAAGWLPNEPATVAAAQAGGPKPGDRIIFRSDEPAFELLIVNRPRTYEVVAGSHEVNWDYYSSWSGAPRLLAVQLPAAEAMHLTRDLSGPLQAQPSQD